MSGVLRVVIEAFDAIEELMLGGVRCVESRSKLMVVLIESRSRRCRDGVGPMERREAAACQPPAQTLSRTQILHSSQTIKRLNFILSFDM